jgi:hypothetical protein
MPLFRIRRTGPDPPREYDLDSPHEVALFLWDRDITDYRLYHGEQEITLPSTEADEIEAYLAGVLYGD